VPRWTRRCEGARAVAAATAVRERACKRRRRRQRVGCTLHARRRVQRRARRTRTQPRATHFVTSPALLRAGAVRSWWTVYAERKDDEDECAPARAAALLPPRGSPCVGADTRLRCHNLACCVCACRLSRPTGTWRTRCCTTRRTCRAPRPRRSACASPRPLPPLLPPPPPRPPLAPRLRRRRARRRAERRRACAAAWRVAPADDAAALHSLLVTPNDILCIDVRPNACTVDCTPRAAPPSPLLLLPPQRTQRACEHETRAAPPPPAPVHAPPAPAVHADSRQRTSSTHCRTAHPRQGRSEGRVGERSSSMHACGFTHCAPPARGFVHHHPQMRSRRAARAAALQRCRCCRCGAATKGAATAHSTAPSPPYGAPQRVPPQLTSARRRHPPPPAPAGPTHARWQQRR
jgi:hypothetical protein